MVLGAGEGGVAATVGGGKGFFREGAGDLFIKPL